MNPRPIKELLILLRDFLPGNIENDNGGSICWSIDDMYAGNDDLITLEECRLLSDYIHDNEPDDHGNYANNHGLTYGFWWPYRELSPRIEFLDRLIEGID